MGPESNAAARGEPDPRPTTYDLPFSIPPDSGLVARPTGPLRPAPKLGRAPAGRRGAGAGFPRHAARPVRRSAADGQKENRPRMGLEAMTAGVPVVAENQGGCAGMIRHGQTGLLANSPNEIAEHLQRLSGDEPYRLALAQNAREAVERGELCDPQRLWEQWLAASRRRQTVGGIGARNDPLMLPTTDNRQPTTDNRQPTTAYETRRRLLHLSPTAAARQMLRCFLAQDYPHRELLILDDASQYADQSGDRWRLVSVRRRFATLGEKRNAAAAPGQQRRGGAVRLGRR